MNLTPLMNRKNFLWVEQYRPQKVEDCILSDNVKNTFQEFVEKGEIPNLLLCGPAGIGKTTIAKALCNELGVDSYVINGSDEGRFLDTVRNQQRTLLRPFRFKEMVNQKSSLLTNDNTTNDVQLLLRRILSVSCNCRFIFTCNYKNKIIEPLHSRCAVFDFTFKGRERRLLHQNSLRESRISSVKNRLSLIQRLLRKLSKTISQISEER